MWEAIISGLTLGLILAISVGPVIFTIIKQSLNNGRQGGFSFVAGVWISDITLVIVSNAFSEIVTNLMEYKKIPWIDRKLLSDTYGHFLCFFQENQATNQCRWIDPSLPQKRYGQNFSSGFFINTLNPNVFIFWLGTATTFAVKYSFQQRIIIFTVCLALNIAADILKVLMAGKLRNRLTLHKISVINKISGSILIAFGIALLLGTIFLGEKI